MIPIEGEPLRYYVRSLSRPRHLHLVDLGALNRNGECGCEHFQFTLRGMIDGGAKGSAKTRCNHIKAVRDVFADAMINEVSDRLERKGIR